MYFTQDQHVYLQFYELNQSIGSVNLIYRSSFERATPRSITVKLAAAMIALSKTRYVCINVSIVEMPHSIMIEL